MKSRKLIFSIVFLSTIVLIGCASTNQVKELSFKIQDLDKKINQINNNIDTIQSEVDQTKNEANRANKRLDNQISLYHK